MMATNLHFRVQVISRGQGKSAPAASSYRSGTVVHAGGRSVVASASYRSGEVLHDERLGRTFDYTRKEDVLHSEILAPDGAPEWVRDRTKLWNGVEASEKRKDARLARDIIAALPRGLDEATYARLVREFVNDNFVARGMVADIAIHTKIASDGLDNPHMHVMLTTRSVDAGGFGAKNRAWNQRELIKEWRDAFEALCNRYLEEAGSGDEVSLKSYKERGIDKIPGEHLGPDAWGLEQQGEETTGGNRNRKVANDNQQKQTARAYFEQLDELVERESDEHQRSAKVEHSDPDGTGSDKSSSDAGQMKKRANRVSVGDEWGSEGRLGADASGRIALALFEAKRVGAAFAAQVRHYTGMLKASMVALGRDESSGVFDRHANLREVAKEQSRKQESDHER